MITKENQAYNDLFARANNVLKLSGEDMITNIDDYFMYLEDLRDAIQNGLTDADNILLILPNDEQRFDIDANSRKISVPSKFGSYGVGVKGDEVAEVIYFSIDRYFDIQDLYFKDIFVEWENPKGDTGLSVTINKTLLLDRGKVVFGWPIGSPITDYPGNVKFSVRFYERGLNSQKEPILTYSFSTLTAMIKINDSLNFEIANEDAITAQIVDKTKLIFDNLKNSENTAVKIPALEPIFEMLYPEEAPLFSLPERVDLVDGEFTLSAKTGFDDKEEYGAGTIAYKWYGKIKDSNGELIEETFKDTPIYELTTDLAKDPNDVYYIKDENTGEFIVYTGEFTKDKELYERYASFVATQAGSYKVSAINTYGKGNNSKEIFSDTCEIPFAEKPNFIFYSDKNVILTKDEPIVTIEVESPDSGELVYNWKFNAIEDNPNTAIDEDNITGEIDVTDKPGYYYLCATNNKNNDSSIGYSDVVRVTYPAVALKPNEIVYYTNGELADTSETQIFANAKETIGVEVVPESSNNNYDSFEYQWQVRNKETSSYDDIIDATTTEYLPLIGGLYQCVITTIYNTDTIQTESKQFLVV